MRSIVLFIASLGFATSVSAATESGFQLRDVGLIGLMSHDIFAWDHKKEINTENGRLDLSTIFDYDGGQRWAKGGNPKNAENAPVYSVTMNLVDFYKAKRKQNLTHEEARRATVALFLAQLRDCYMRTLGKDLPEHGLDEMPTNHEQAALRAMHDLLPGKVNLYGRVFRRQLVLTSFIHAKTRLNEKEMSQTLRNFDGDYDEEYKNIEIPLTKVKLNLMEIDRKFIEKFSPYKQVDMLRELARSGRGELPLREVFFMHHLDAMFAKALCSKGNHWLPTNMECR